MNPIYIFLFLMTSFNFAHEGNYSKVSICSVDKSDIKQIVLYKDFSSDANSGLISFERQGDSGRILTGEVNLTGTNTPIHSITASIPNYENGVTFSISINHLLRRRYNGSAGFVGAKNPLRLICRAVYE